MNTDDTKPPKPLTHAELMVEVRRNERAWTYVKCHARALQMSALGALVAIPEGEPAADLLAGLHRALTSFVAELDDRSAVAGALLLDASATLGLPIPDREDDKRNLH
jgi:hypothetical protein